MHCPFCGNAVADGTIVCPSCNANLTPAADVTPLQQAADQQSVPGTGASADTAPMSDVQASAPSGTAPMPGAPVSAPSGTAPMPGMPVPMPGAPQAPDQQQPQKKSSRKGLIGAIVAIVVLLGAILGLNFFGVLNIPFLPRSPEIVLLKTVGAITEDGEFFAKADADMTLDMDMSIAGQNVGASIDANGYADGKVTGFDAKDPFTTKINDGMFEADGMVSLSGIPGLGTQNQTITARGGYSLDLVEGVFNYSIIEPYSTRDTVKIDVEELRKTLEEQTGTFDLNKVKNLKAQGDTITFTIEAEEFDPDNLTDEQKQAFEQIGMDPHDISTDMSDYDVTVVNHEDKKQVDINIKSSGTMSMSIDEKKAGIGAETVTVDSTVTVDMDLTLRD